MHQPPASGKPHLLQTWAASVLSHPQVAWDNTGETWVKPWWQPSIYKAKLGMSNFLQQKPRWYEPSLSVWAAPEPRLLSQPHWHRCHNHQHYLSQLCLSCWDTEENSASSSCWSQGWANSCHFRWSPQQGLLCFQEHDLSHLEPNPHRSYEPTLFHVLMFIRLDLESLWLPTLKRFRAIISRPCWHVPNPHSPSQSWAWEGEWTLTTAMREMALQWRKK